MHNLEWDELAMLSGIVNRVDLNDRAVRVICPPRDQDGRLGVETMIGCKKLWVPPTNLVLIPNLEALKGERFANMSQIDREDSMMFLHANEGSVKLSPGVRLGGRRGARLSRHPRRKRERERGYGFGKV